MASSDNISMAVFCDFENVALGVRDANYEKFDIKPVLERLLLKGSIVVKKAYCDWDRYKAFKAPMHEANFELIEIPHVRQSGKNSADIRMVVDALDLCYTKAHVDTFVIISGDSDFSPLVSKLRENAKRVIGVGVKQSTSDLLVANCDEFIFYDDLVREKNRAAAKRKEELDARRGQPSSRRPSDDKRKEELEARKVQALEMVVETFDALVSERGDTGKIWASLLKDTLKRRRPDFSETYYGFRTFGNLLEEAQTRGLFEFGRDEKSGTYVYRSAASPVAMPAPELVVAPETAGAEEAVGAEQGGEEAQEARPEPRRRSRGGRGGRGRDAAPGVPELTAPDVDLAQPVIEEAPAEPEPVAEAPAEAVVAEEAAVEPAPVKERRRAPRKPAAKKAAAEAPVEAAAELPAPTVAQDSAADMADLTPDAPEAEAAGDDEAKPARKKAARPAHKAPARKAAPRSRRPAKPKTGE
ncbi:NYN domain-containing protein [Massilia sp. IC2-476]|uniref:NYN domain-containing protein n=1 Tax=Massilia sp. IC2-476 TaxID=2887199 RepID=UPI001D10979A|nr:NYN domain-containing protein [Massilia sp. IC2-476]MCC2970309.1 NYN domain-containing protein [Massilia sp. IC2-476]